MIFTVFRVVLYEMLNCATKEQRNCILSAIHSDGICNMLSLINILSVLLDHYFI